MISDVIQEWSLSIENFLTQRALSLLAKENFTVHVDKRLLKLKSWIAL